MANTTTSTGLLPFSFVSPPPTPVPTTIGTLGGAVTSTSLELVSLLPAVLPSAAVSASAPTPTQPKRKRTRKAKKTAPKGRAVAAPTPITLPPPAGTKEFRRWKNNEASRESRKRRKDREQIMAEKMDALKAKCAALEAKLAKCRCGCA